MCLLRFGVLDINILLPPFFLGLGSAFCLVVGRAVGDVFEADEQVGM